MTFDTTTVLFAALGGLIIILLLWVVRLEIKLSRMRAGTSGQRIEEVMKHIRDSLSDLHSFKNTADYRLKETEEKLRSSVRHVETIRFNPFQGTGSGGNQSFASAFVNENGDGVVISSLYSRDRVSVFSKPLRQFESDYDLFDEEQEAVKRARYTLTQGR